MPTRLLKKTWLIKSIFFASAFIVLLVGGITYRNIDDLSHSSDLLTQTHKVNVNLNQILSYLKDAETGQLGYIITNEPVYLEHYNTAKENINNVIVELKELTRDNTTQQKSLRELHVLIDQCLENFEKYSSFSTVENYNNADFIEIFLNGKNLMDSIHVKIKSMINYENGLFRLREAAYKSYLNLTPKSLYLVLLFSLVLMFTAYNKIISDFRELKKNYEQLEIFKKSTNQAEIISSHGNWIWNIEKNTFLYSDNLYRLLGEKPQSFKPTLENYLRFVHPEDKGKFQKDVEKMMVDEILPFTYHRIIQKNGDIKHFKAYGKLYANSEGKKQLLGITTDISSEIEHYTILEEHNLELERSNKELLAFNYVASHDLQEPLRKIQIFLSRLEEKEADKLSESGLLYIERIKNASSRMRMLINDLLQFSRTNKADQAFEVSDINLLLNNAKQDLAEVISQKNALINADVFPEMNIIPFQIHQLFSNLLSNSLKYISEGKNPEINIRYSEIKASDEPQILNPKKSLYHKITFSDNGIGFDNDYAENIFVLFNRLHNKDEYSGTGIGLSICKKIVENHQGYILAHGEPNVGATFTIYLPAN